MGQKRCHLDGSGSGGIEIQPATMKVDRRFEVFFVSETICTFLDRLDLGNRDRGLPPSHTTWLAGPHRAVGIVEVDAFEFSRRTA